MSLPSFAPFPPADVLEQLLPDELEACLEAWTSLAHGYLLLPQVMFSKKVAEEPSVTEFLVSYMSENLQVDIVSLNAPKARALRSNVFRLTHRTFMESLAVPPQLLEYPFLENLSVLYGAPNLTGHNSSLSDIIAKVWDASSSTNAPPSFAKQRASSIHALNTSKQDTPTALNELFIRTACVLSVSYQYGQYLTLGSDFLDALSGYFQSNARVQKGIVIVAHLCLISLTHPKNPMFSTLIDHLYALKSSPAGKLMLQTLCSATSFLRKLRQSLIGAEAARAQPMLDELSTFKIDVKGKGKAIDGKFPRNRKIRHASSSDERFAQEMEWITLVTQVKDVFPHLDTQVINTLLHKNGGDIEKVTAHLLDRSLPAHAQQSEKTFAEPLQAQPQVPFGQEPHQIPSMAPISKPLAGRRSVFDGDDFSRQAISPSQIHRGRSQADSRTADTLLSAPTSKSDKAAILSALAAFDSDDDERDDTYDMEDVGGTVDSALPGTSDDAMDAEGLKQNVHEEALWQAWKTSPGSFARDQATRRSPARAALRSDTGMTDEAIEGWAIMLQRDPRKVKRLEAMFSMAGSGQQRGLGRTAWQDSPVVSETDTGEEADTDGDPGPATRGGRGGFRDRGRGRGRGGARGGRGANVAGPADDRGTQVARQKKDANKGSRANHNRRDQRARKVARGGFAG